MKLFIYDSENDYVRDEHDLGPLTTSERIVVSEVIGFLEDVKLSLGKNLKLVTAEGYERDPSVGIRFHNN